MPVIDAQEYRIIYNLLLPAMRSQLVEADLESAADVCYFNIYFGINTLLVDGRTAWHVCKRLKFGYAIAAFHGEARKLVWKRSGKVRDDTGLCLTLLWQADQVRADDILELLSFAESIVDNVELLKGVPCPLPLRPLQLPSSFEVALLRAAGGRKLREEIIVGELDKVTVQLSQDDVLKIGVLSGAFGPMDLEALSRSDRAVRISGLWQRKAIEASGLADWPGVVLYSNTWIETLIVQLAIILNEANGEAIEDVRKALQPGLHKFAVTQLGSKFLGGRWDYTKEDTAFGRWYKICYLKRHEIVHGGHFATRDEADEAYDAAHQLAFWITGLAGTVSDPKIKQSLGMLIPMSKHPRAKLT